MSDSNILILCDGTIWYDHNKSCEEIGHIAENKIYLRCKISGILMVKILNEYNNWLNMEVRV